MSEVISLINLKGGVGKTVSSINIAYSFAEFNKKVLIVDADSQGNIATSLGMIADELDNTLCDLIDEAIADGVTEQRVVECIRQVGKVDIIPATLEKYIRDITAFMVWLNNREVCKSIVIEYKNSIIESYAPASANSMFSRI